MISFKEKYEHVVVVGEESKNLTTLAITELMETLQAYEQIVERRTEDSIERAFQAKVNVKYLKPKDLKKWWQNSWKKWEKTWKEEKKKGKQK